MKAIILTTPEVQAALTGAVQVRRRVKAPFVIGDHPDTDKPWPLYPGYVNDGENEGEPIACPFGVPGDKAWVREKYGVDARSHRVEYAADWGPNQEGCIWRSPVTMPRWASRLTLELVAVRVERDGTGWVWVGDWRRV